eukprot:5590845-Pleurochrysis_carterae.AAC.2
MRLAWGPVVLGEAERSDADNDLAGGDRPSPAPARCAATEPARCAARRRGWRGAPRAARAPPCGRAPAMQTGDDTTELHAQGFRGWPSWQPEGF